MGYLGRAWGRITRHREGYCGRLLFRYVTPKIRFYVYTIVSQTQFCPMRIILGRWYLFVESQWLWIGFDLVLGWRIEGGTTESCEN